MQFPTTSGGPHRRISNWRRSVSGYSSQPRRISAMPSHVVTGAAVEPHARTLLAHDDAETVVLDLVQPRSACWRLRRLGGEAGPDETCGAPQTGARMVRSP